MIDFTKTPSPCYLLDEQRLRNNLELIKSVKERAGIDIILAFKGFAMWSAFPTVREYIQGATSSSAYETQLAFEEMKTRAHVYAPAYTQADFDTIKPMASHITFNSLAQLSTYLPQIKPEDNIEVGLRINPEFSEVETDLYNPCAVGSRLGLTAKQLGNTLPDGVDGLHFHALCESDSSDLVKTLAAVEKNFAHVLPKVKWVNMGGGHLMTRKGYNIELLIETLKAFKAKWNVDVILEPGSAFAWDTGFLITTVVDVIENGGINTAIIDSSFTAHMPDCLEMPYKPVVLGASSEPVEGKPSYRIGGNSCLAGDYMGNWWFDKPLQIGDKIVFNDMIHYTMVKTTMFNGIDHPAIAINRTNGEIDVVRKFNYLDYKNRLS